MRTTAKVEVGVGANQKRSQAEETLRFAAAATSVTGPAPGARRR